MWKMLLVAKRVERKVGNSLRTGLEKTWWNPLDLSKREVALWKACGLEAGGRLMAGRLLSFNKWTHLLSASKGGRTDRLKFLQHLP